LRLKRIHISRLPEGKKRRIRKHYVVVKGRVPKIGGTVYVDDRGAREYTEPYTVDRVEEIGNPMFID
jgi:hypothetical protein